MNLHCDKVCACWQAGNRKIGWIINVRGVTGRCGQSQIGVSDHPVWEIGTENLLAIQPHCRTSRSCQTEIEICDDRIPRDVKRAAEIGRDEFVGRLWAKVHCCGRCQIAIPEAGDATAPPAVIVARLRPVGAEVLARVGELPLRAAIDKSGVKLICPKCDRLNPGQPFTRDCLQAVYVRV